MTQSRLASATGRSHSLAVFIGRFSPPHLGHLGVIQEALLVAEIVLIAIGSAYAARSPHFVPFTAQERETMIRLMLTPEENLRVRFVHVEDQGNMPKWTALVRRAANEIEPDNSKITLVGHSKDHTSFYLKAFKGWKSREVANIGGYSSTTFRQLFFVGSPIKFLALECPEIHPEVLLWLAEFAKTDDYVYLCEEHVKVSGDRRKYGTGPFLTGDAVVIQGDHVLMIRRGNHPYRGKLAFPGGFVDPDERVVDAIFRELGEETKLKVPSAVLRMSLLRVDYFDAPYRDPRGRIVTWAGLIFLDPQPPEAMTDPRDIAKYLALPRVTAADDAAEAFWMPIADIRREDCAFDVFTILQHMLDFIPTGEQ